MLPNIFFPLAFGGIIKKQNICSYKSSNYQKPSIFWFFLMIPNKFLLGITRKLKWFKSNFTLNIISMTRLIQNYPRRIVVIILSSKYTRYKTKCFFCFFLISSKFYLHTRIEKQVILLLWNCLISLVVRFSLQSIGQNPSIRFPNDEGIKANLYILMSGSL
jgi:hypothetical protein